MRDGVPICCCASAASGAARRPPATIAKKARRGISGKQVESIGAVLHAIARGLLSCSRSVADYGRRPARALSITVEVGVRQARGRGAWGADAGTRRARKDAIGPLRPTTW